MSSAEERDWKIWAGYVLLIYTTLYFANIPMMWLYRRGLLRPTCTAVTTILLGRSSK